MANNTAWLAIARKWPGVMVDADASAVDRARATLGWFNQMVTVIDLLVEEHNAASVLLPLLSTRPDVFSLDVDSVDYFVARALFERGLRPRICVVEYNSAYGPERRCTIKPARVASTPEPLYYGVSIAGWRNFFASHDYHFVGVERTGVNAFFVDPSSFDRDFLTLYAGWRSERTSRSSEAPAAPGRTSSGASSGSSMSISERRSFPPRSGRVGDRVPEPLIWTRYIWAARERPAADRSYGPAGRLAVPMLSRRPRVKRLGAACVLVVSVAAIGGSAGGEAAGRPVNLGAHIAGKAGHSLRAVHDLRRATFASPWCRTLSSPSHDARLGRASCPAGDVVCLERGAYRTRTNITIVQSGRPGRPITFRGYRSRPLIAYTGGREHVAEFYRRRSVARGARPRSADRAPEDLWQGPDGGGGVRADGRA